MTLLQTESTRHHHRYLSSQAKADPNSSGAQAPPAYASCQVPDSKQIVAFSILSACARKVFFELVIRRKLVCGFCVLFQCGNLPRKIRSKNVFARTANHIAKAKIVFWASHLVRLITGGWILGSRRVCVYPRPVTRYTGGGVMCSLQQRQLSLSRQKMLVEVCGILSRSMS